MRMSRRQVNSRTTATTHLEYLEHYQKERSVDSHCLSSQLCSRLLLRKRRMAQAEMSGPLRSEMQLEQELAIARLNQLLLRRRKRLARAELAKEMSGPLPRERRLKQEMEM